MAERYDWKKALEHVHEILGEYLELMGEPTVNPMFALASLNALLSRYNSGERSDKLYKAMMGAE
jgi:hypothetical protein